MLQVDNFKWMFAHIHQNIMIKYSVPESRVLGPLLYTVYMVPLADVIAAFGISFHFYADDSQLWIPVVLDNRINNCYKQLDGYYET